MDISRPERGRRRRRRQWMFGVAAMVALGGLTYGLSQLKPAAPRVDRHAVYTDTVKRGEMLRQVWGNGTLVPEEVNWIPAITAGRVERIRVLPGAAVLADTILVELTNPEVEHAAFEAEWQLKAAEAQWNKLKARSEERRVGKEC